MTGTPVADIQEKETLMIAGLEHTIRSVFRPFRREDLFGRWLRRRLKSSPWLEDVLLVVTAPVIYVGALPFALLDLFVSVYQFICFPVYGLKKVPRDDFILIDRHRLPYLTPLEKLNCAYCGYGNGVIAYAREVAARTEKRWCPIKHRRNIRAPHDSYEQFLAYGDRVGAEVWRASRQATERHERNVDKRRR